MINCQVEATVEFSNQSTTLQLLDNGSGADVSGGDGIYSAYFTKFKGAGRYGVKVNSFHLYSNLLNCIALYHFNYSYLISCLDQIGPDI